MALLEICVDSIAGLHEAVENGADRIELCAALSVGGLSPSYAMLTEAQKVDVPVHVMVRPRAGDFVYSPSELEAMGREINLVKKTGLAGVVFGAGDNSGLDWSALKQLCEYAEGLDITVHRVIDLLSHSDRLNALPKLKALNVNRILTSGGELKAVDAVSSLKELIQNAPKGLVVMPGSGVTEQNINTIIHSTSAIEIHASAGVKATSSNQKSLRLGFESIDSRITDGQTVKALKSLCCN